MSLLRHYRGIGAGGGLAPIGLLGVLAIGACGAPSLDVSAGDASGPPADGPAGTPEGSALPGPDGAPGDAASPPSDGGSVGADAMTGVDDATALAGGDADADEAGLDGAVPNAPLDATNDLALEASADASPPLPNVCGDGVRNPATEECDN